MKKSIFLLASVIALGLIFGFKVYAADTSVMYCYHSNVLNEYLYTISAEEGN